MEITVLGHAGFCVETEAAIVMMDPWLSPNGAFDSAWFQFPCNHHLAAFVQEKLSTSRKTKYIYISHEHKDHFDISFLRSLRSVDFAFLIPNYRRKALRTMLQEIPCQGVIECRDGQELSIPGGKVTVYIDDSEMDRDSAIHVQSGEHSFLNLNDCKIHDRIPEIVARHGAMDVFTAQFSGAVWHPVCYSYPQKQYEAISMKKRMSKFEAVARAIETINPRFYLTSAGPACFLDPMLFHLNFERLNIFPRGPVFLDYLNRRLQRSKVGTRWFNPMPGDVLDVTSGNWVYQSPIRVTDANVKDYLEAYQARYELYFRTRQTELSEEEREKVWQRLFVILQEKLNKLTLHDRIPIPLYFRLSDDKTKRFIRIDFPSRRIEYVNDIVEKHYYSIATPAWEVARILHGSLTWEDFTLTFRMRLNRDPDVYHVLIHGFLTMEPEDMNWFCAKVLDAESKTERILIDADGKRYSVNRYCPHQGADLSAAWVEHDRYVVCPRHRWKYDLKNEGQCTTCAASIRAFVVEDN